MVDEFKIALLLQESLQLSDVPFCSFAATCIEKSAC